MQIEQPRFGELEQDNLKHYDVSHKNIANPPPHLCQQTGPWRLNLELQHRSVPQLQRATCEGSPEVSVLAVACSQYEQLGSRVFFPKWNITLHRSCFSANCSRPLNSLTDLARNVTGLSGVAE